MVEMELDADENRRGTAPNSAPVKTDGPDDNEDNDVAIAAAERGALPEGLANTSGGPDSTGMLIGLPEEKSR